eukprot:CAMPEP_0194497154 /NCGR_PEP_ID=MMETSP0253-20130528/14188_1 /TAXON_ID=2966 /ORGANISM="Noctiluca scintillans" /LENGTH=325 /DNA_ID=CAMNT_0039338631 /DNA_START=60 /DNA_END=1038 /DNA_ORIENTATION=+
MTLVRVLSPTLFSNGMSLPALATFLSLLSSKQFRNVARANLITQLAVFIPMAQIPVLLTGRLTYVDLAWPSGLLAMGLVSLGRALRDLFKGADVDGLGDRVRPVLIALAYIFQGGRMAMGAWMLFLSGHMRQEMQRYTYQRRRWAAAGISGSLAIAVELQKEAFTQCLANLGPLSVPLALQSCVGGLGAPRAIEVLSWLLWGSSFVWEHTSDLQKLAFARDMKKKGLKKQVCDYGFWNYSRHPNYFGEWMVWVALALASIPALQAYVAKDTRKDEPSTFSKAATAIGLCCAPLSSMCVLFIGLAQRQQNFIRCRIDQITRVTAEK